MGSTLDAIGSALTNFFTNNTSDTFYINTGGLNTNVDNTSFRPGIDKVVDNEGYMGGMLSGGGLGGSLDPNMSKSDAVLGFLNVAAGLSSMFKPQDSMQISTVDSDSLKNGVYTGKGKSDNPLYISVIGMDISKACQKIVDMHGGF
ncbi:MAG: hypothetical protein DI529_17895 [Chryseobacterium sp.]|nr:MAG: hypothetical protein DI529_17895 [Chryseobacterium sp.]